MPAISAATIASTVEEQSAATREIARGDQQASQGLNAAADLSHQSGLPRTEVDSFIAKVRVA